MYSAGEAEQGGRRGDRPSKNVQLVKIYMSILPYYVLLYKVSPLNGRVPEPPLQCI